MSAGKNCGNRKPHIKAKNSSVFLRTKTRRTRSCTFLSARRTDGRRDRKEAASINRGITTTLKLTAMVFPSKRLTFFPQNLKRRTSYLFCSRHSSELDELCFGNSNYAEFPDIDSRAGRSMKRTLCAFHRTVPTQSKLLFTFNNYLLDDP